MANVYLIAAVGCFAVVIGFACFAQWAAYRQSTKWFRLYQQAREHGSVTFHNLQVLREAAKAHLDKPSEETQFRLRAVLKDL